MRFELRFGALLLGAALLSGCTMTEGQWNTTRAALKGSPAIRQEAIAKCAVRLQSKPLGQRREMAKLMNVSLDRSPRVFCNRFVNAWAGGRLSYAKFRALFSLSADNSDYIAMLQGR